MQLFVSLNSCVVSLVKCQAAVCLHCTLGWWSRILHDKGSPCSCEWCLVPEWQSVTQSFLSFATEEEWEIIGKSGNHEGGAATVGRTARGPNAMIGAFLPFVWKTNGHLSLGVICHLLSLCEGKPRGRRHGAKLKYWVLAPLISIAGGLFNQGVMREGRRLWEGQPGGPTWWSVPSCHSYEKQAGHLLLGGICHLLQLCKGEPRDRKCGAKLKYWEVAPLISISGGLFNQGVPTSHMGRFHVLITTRWRLLDWIALWL